MTFLQVLFKDCAMPLLYLSSLGYKLCSVELITHWHVTENLGSLRTMWAYILSMHLLPQGIARTIFHLIL